MIRTYRRIIALAGSVILPFVSGCASVDSRSDYERASRAISEATGADQPFEPGQEDRVDRLIAELVSKGLTADAAVQICLLGNPGLRAAYLDVGMARADVVQSSLFSNPSLALSIALPEGGGRSNIQTTLAQNIVDLWQIPIRKRVAARALDAAILHLARQASQLAADTRSAFHAAVAADQAARLAEDNVGITEQLLEAATARQAAGAVGDLDVNLARGAVYAAEIEWQHARLEAGSARRRLAVLLGLTTRAENLQLLHDAWPSPWGELNSDEIEQVALDSRLDVLALRVEADANRNRINLEIAKVIPEFSVGLYEERSERRALPGRKIPADTARASIAAGQLTAPEIQSRAQRKRERSQEVDNILGPAFNLTLPIFDQNQAQIAKARLSYEQSLLRLDALQREVVQTVRQGVDQVETTRHVARYFHEKLLPQARANLELSRESYRSGRASLIVLVDAQRVLLSTRRDAIAADRETAVALSELERLTARPLRSLLAASAATSRPAAGSHPAARQAPDRDPPGAHR